MAIDIKNKKPRDAAKSLEKGRIHILRNLDQGAEKIDEILEDFKQSIPLLKAIGISVNTVQFDFAAPPQLLASLAAKIDDTDPEVIQEYIDLHADKSLLVLILKGFMGAFEIRDKLECLGFNGLEADLKLTVPPSISVRMLEIA
ncbi:MAG: hypothetical protein HRU20_27510 [Pseudomonadales bacterium]|nr:hypothetical protein [Pseudomonadales bacterium]